MSTEPDLELTHDVERFLAGATEHLASDPVLHTVVATIAERTRREAAEGIAPPPEDWWLTARSPAGAVLGVAMRTAPFAPRPAYLLPMPDDVARALARLLHEHGEDLVAANGALPAARVFLDEVARLAGGTVEVRQHTRLFELGELLDPRPVPGGLRTPRADEVELCTTWLAAFGSDADEQAGRERGSSSHETPSAQEVRRRVAQGRLWLWEDANGEPVHLVGASAPAYGVARVGPVYTPPEQRGRGWASAAVAEVSRRLRGLGARPSLFTDRANPTSNRIYTALGYRPVADMVALVRSSP